MIESYRAGDGRSKGKDRKKSHRTDPEPVDEARACRALAGPFEPQFLTTLLRLDRQGVHPVLVPVSSLAHATQTPECDPEREQNGQGDDNDVDYGSPRRPSAAERSSHAKAGAEDGEEVQKIRQPALGGISINLARAVGPAIAGLLIARVGVGAVFALNTATFLILIAVLMVWRRPIEAAAQSPERFLPALRAGARYVRYSPVVRRILLRLALFVVPATAVWALLPLVAKQLLGLGAGGYGLLLGALGGGAVAGALALPRVTARLSGNRMLTVASIAYAVAMGVLVLTRHPVAAFLILIPAGAAWVVVIANVNAMVQLFLPGWVRGRGLAAYQIVLFGSQAVAATAWGLVASRSGLVTTFLSAAGVLLAGAATIILWPLHDVRGLNRDATRPCRSRRSASIRTPRPVPCW